MGKLEVGMKFSSLKQAYQLLGIENEYYGQRKNKELKFSEFCNWHRINKHSLVIDEVFDYGTGTTRTLSTLIRLNTDLCGNAI